MAEFRFVLGSIERAKQTIEISKRKIEKEQREKLPNWELVIGMEEDEIRYAEKIIKK